MFVSIFHISSNLFWKTHQWNVFPDRIICQIRDPLFCSNMPPRTPFPVCSSNQYAWAGASPLPVLAGDFGRCVQAWAKLPFGCTACLFMQITPNQEAHNWWAAWWVPQFNWGFKTALCHPDMEEYGETSCQQMCCDFSKASFKPNN